MKSNDAYSLLDIRDNLLLSRAGNLTCTFRMEGPEAYSLSGDDIDERDRMFKDAFRFLPDGSYVHKQDVFLKSRYRAVLNWFLATFPELTEDEAKTTAAEEAAPGSETAADQNEEAEMDKAS